MSAIPIRVRMIGNSLSGSTFVSGQGYTFQNQFIRQAPQFGFDVREFPRKTLTASMSDNCSALFSLEGDLPDVLYFQGTFEQCGGTQATALSASVTATAQALSLNATYTYKHVIRLYDEAGNEEWVQLLATNGSRVRRGLFGSRPQSWVAADTIIDSNTSTTDWEAGLTLWRAYLEQIANWVVRRSDGQWPILLFGDKWFGGPSDYATQMKAMIDSWGYPNIGFVEFIKDDGTRIQADGNCVGPSATMTDAPVQGAGTPPALTITCLNAAGVRNLQPGMYVALWDKSESDPPALPAAYEFVKISTVDFDAAEFTVASANRNLLGSSSSLAALANGDIVAAVNMQDVRTAVDNLGAQTYLAAAYDTHPINEGYYWMARAALRETQRVLESLK